MHNPQLLCLSSNSFKLSTDLVHSEARVVSWWTFEVFSQHYSNTIEYSSCKSAEVENVQFEVSVPSNFNRQLNINFFDGLICCILYAWYCHRSNLNPQRWDWSSPLVLYFNFRRTPSLFQVYRSTRVKTFPVIWIKNIRSAPSTESLYELYISL